MKKRRAFLWAGLACGAAAGVVEALGRTVGSMFLLALITPERLHLTPQRRLITSKRTTY